MRESLESRRGSRERVEAVFDGGVPSLPVNKTMYPLLTPHFLFIEKREMRMERGVSLEHLLVYQRRREGNRGRRPLILLWIQRATPRQTFEEKEKEKRREEETAEGT